MTEFKAQYRHLSPSTTVAVTVVHYMLTSASLH